jgi:hypothetical protein
MFQVERVERLTQGHLTAVVTKLTIRAPGFGAMTEGRRPGPPESEHDPWNIPAISSS